ncbi:MAG: hypothetical protein B5M53_05040 [Candidatus Cloacimonas sp. 4484_209]|nr:MAG: hypothetical protein B5M53_05040 [Candidatus Cloacimonas sp. 4484_209]
MFDYLIITLIILFLILWLIAVIKDHPLKHIFLALLAISCITRKELFGRPLFVIPSVLFIISYFYLSISLKRKRMNIWNIKACDDFWIKIARLSYIIYILFTLISTMFGEYRHNYLNSIMYCFLSIITAFCLFKYLDRYRSANVMAAFTLFLLSFIVSIEIWYTFISDYVPVRSLPSYSLIMKFYEHASHYTICSLGIISGTILFLYNLADQEHHKDVKGRITLYFYFCGIFLSGSALILIGSRSALIIIFLYIASLIFLRKKGKSRAKILIAIVILLLLFSPFTHLIISRSNLIQYYYTRFELQFLNCDPLAKMFGSKRATLNELMWKSYKFGLLGNGRGAAGTLCGKYYNISTHNAFLEILYDGGPFSLLAYMLMILSLFLLGIRRKDKSRFIPVFVSIYLVISSMAGGSGLYIKDALLVGISCSALKHLAE